MHFKVVIKKSEEGYAVWCPALSGCFSQGDTEAEALKNIRDAITEWLSVVDEMTVRDREPDETAHVVEVVDAHRAEAAGR